jgi:2-keto-4-pentenoate hydratase/2-oxohepta-3-ene-1,7-dioic acid hydratase in catechol pathway
MRLKSADEKLSSLEIGTRMNWAVGLNYRDHAAEAGRDVPTAPTLFAKSPGSLIAHEDAIVIPPHVAQPDYEGEVAVVIGRTARDVSEADALSYVAGITCAHDVSSRDHQFNTGQFTWSKSFDTFCPLGPALVSIDEVDVQNLSLETRLNGEVVQSASTRDLVFPIPTLVAWISQGTTLLAGDVILTGTPAGVGAGRTPPRWLLDGDVVEITVGGVGTLRNRVTRTGA